MNIFLEVLFKYLPPQLIWFFLVVLGGSWAIGQLANDFKIVQEVEANNWNPQVWVNENRLGFEQDQKSFEALKSEKNSPFSELNGLKQVKLIEYWVKYVEQAEKTFLIGEFREKYGIGLVKAGEGAGKGTIVYPSLDDAERDGVLRHLTPTMRNALVADEENRSKATLAKIEASIKGFDTLKELADINVGIGKNKYHSLEEAQQGGRLKGKGYTPPQLMLMNRTLKEMGAEPHGENGHAGSAGTSTTTASCAMSLTGATVRSATGSSERRRPAPRATGTAAPRRNRAALATTATPPAPRPVSALPAAQALGILLCCARAAEMG